MTPAEFVKLVQDMREVQKKYFRLKTHELLTQAKDLEKKVDIAAKELSTPERGQGRLM